MKGWPGYLAWISSDSLTARSSVIETAIGTFKAEVLQQISRKFDIRATLDFSGYEQQGLFLEVEFPAGARQDAHRRVASVGLDILARALAAHRREPTPRAALRLYRLCELVDELDAMPQES